MKRRVCIILIMFSLIVCFTGVTYSLFNSVNYLYTGKMNVAEFIFATKRTDHIQLDFTDLKPGDVNEFEFEVTNTKDNVITNVTTEYQITIKTFHFMPLLIELYKDNDVVMTCDETYSRNSNNALVCNSLVWEMDHKKIETDKFKIKVTFPDEYNTYDYTELVDYIDIDISSWQKIDGR